MHQYDEIINDIEDVSKAVKQRAIKTVNALNLDNMSRMQGNFINGIDFYWDIGDDLILEMSFHPDDKNTYMSLIIGGKSKVGTSIHIDNLDEWIKAPKS